MIKRSISNRLGTLLLVAAGAFAGACAGDVGEGESTKAEPASEVSALPAEALVTTLKLSPTHSVTFYDIGNGGGVYTEVYDMDKDVSATAELAKNEQLSAVYNKLAGQQADSAVLTRLAAMDAQRAALAEDEPAEAPGEGSSAADYVADQQPGADKAWADDLSFFATNYCGGCLGQEGSRRGWEPSQYRTCTTSPDVCQAAHLEQTYDKSARNFTAFAYNASSQGNGVYTSYLRDPCQHDSWWSRNFTVCRKGAQLEYIQMAPRQIIRSVTTAGQSWKYGVKVTGPWNVALMLDFY